MHGSFDPYTHIRVNTRSESHAKIQLTQCRSVGIGRRTGLKIRRTSLGVWVQVPPPAPHLPLMALFKTRSAAVYGIDAHLIDVEVDMHKSGAASDSVTVGMPDVAVRESRERIKSALMNSGFGYPNKSFTINLAPANIRKEGAGFDLPMALGILGAMGTVGRTDQHLLVGELSLDGTLRPVRGVLSMAVCARREGIPNLLVPAENAAEAAVA